MFLKFFKLVKQISPMKNIKVKQRNLRILKHTNDFYPFDHDITLIQKLYARRKAVKIMEGKSFPERTRLKVTKSVLSSYGYVVDENFLRSLIRAIDYE